MIYDDVNRKWLPSGSSSGLSRVHIYQHVTNNTFRVVGRKLQDHEVSLHPLVLIFSSSCCLAGGGFCPLVSLSRRRTVVCLTLLLSDNKSFIVSGRHKLLHRSWSQIQSGDSDFPSVARPETGLRTQLQYERRCGRIRGCHAQSSGHPHVHQQRDERHVQWFEHHPERSQQTDCTKRSVSVCGCRTSSQ